MSNSETVPAASRLDQLEREKRDNVMDYNSVTEQPGIRITQEALAMLYTRYMYAASFCEGKDALEVGCGAGMGLGLLAKRARTVVGGDYSGALLRRAREHYQDRIALLRLDAHRLPFSDASFDVAILFEAIYYLANPQQFFGECHRVLRFGGTLMVCSVNKDWRDFNPSPLAARYFSASELVASMHKSHFHVELFGAYPVSNGSTKDSLVSAVKRTAVRLHLMPKTMKGKELLKRLFFGQLQPIPFEVQEGMAEYAQPVGISPDRPNSDYKVLYAVGCVR